MSTLARPDAGATPDAARSRRILPRPRWVVSAVLLFVLVCVLLVEAYANAKFTSDWAGQAHIGRDTVPDEVVHGGPIINATDGRVRSYRLPPKTIALTFDDGPDPVWTPQVLRVLREHRVDATFFVVGVQAARHPDLVHRLVAEGNELGVHTFTHPRLSQLDDWRRELEYSQTQLAIARAAGVKTSLLRFPYSSRADAIDDATWSLVRHAGELGYLSVFNDTDSRDWAKPGVETIVANSTPAGDQGAIVLMHDAGGDRAQTITALAKFIPAMQAKGYRFTTVSEGLNLALADRAVVENPGAAAVDMWRGRALVWAIQIADSTIAVLAVLFVVVGVLTLTRTALLFALAGRQARRRRARDWAWGPPVTEPVSVIVPAYNESQGIAAAVRSLAAGEYPDIEVIVVDDGSTDGTADIVEALGLPNVRVVRVPNGGKPSALDTGVALARHEIVVMVDGDTVFEPDTIRRLVQPFAEASVGAVAGNVKVGNRGTVVARWQHIEYVIGLNLDRRLYETLQCVPTVPGAIGAFRRAALREVGGVSGETLAEDTDLTMTLSRAGWRVACEARAVAWTEAPAKLSQLWAQRYRWSYGTMQALWKHRRAIVDTGASGRFGRRALPMLALFTVALPLFAPLIDLLAVYGLVFQGTVETAVAWLAMLGVQFLTAVVAFRLDREPLRPLWALPLQQFVYRQLIYLVVIQSIVTALTGARLRWHKLRRTGLATAGNQGRSH
jgi:cellulose synthase/poly-beta-1,6-N-acetylglucosamine synthase-like glycosyltransferase/peptidoglycan/xylan/chitin deacetylase (PgdA/CDA1 family)